MLLGCGLSDVVRLLRDNCMVCFSAWFWCTIFCAIVSRSIVCFLHRIMNLLGLFIGGNIGFFLDSVEDVLSSGDNAVIKNSLYVMDIHTSTGVTTAPLQFFLDTLLDSFTLFLDFLDCIEISLAQLCFSVL